MGIEALLHSTIHGRHGKSTGSAQGAGGESLTGGFAGLLQGHLSSATRTAEAGESTNALPTIDGEVAQLLPETAVPDAALLAALIPAPSAGERRAFVSGDGSEPTPSNRTAPASADPAQDVAQEALAAAAAALEIITPRSTPPTDTANAPAPRVEQTASSQAPSREATPQALPAGDGRFAERRFTLPTTRATASAELPASGEAPRQALADEPTAKSPTPATANLSAPVTAHSAVTAESGRNPPANIAAATAPGKLPSRQHSAADAPPTQRTAISRAFSGDRPSTPTPPTSNPTSNPTTTPTSPPSSVPAQVASATAPTAQTADTNRVTDANMPATLPPPPTATDSPREARNAAALEANRTATSRVTPATPSSAGAAQRPAGAGSDAPEIAATPGRPAPQEISPPTLVTQPTGAALTSNAPAQAVLASGATDTQLGRRPSIRNPAPETRTSTTAPLAATSSGSNEEDLAVSESTAALRTTSSALPMPEVKPPSTTFAVGDDTHLSTADGTIAPADSAKLAAMPAAAANGAAVAGLAANAGTDAAQNTEASVQLPTHLRDPRWAEHLGERVVVLAQGEKSSAQIDINPAQLGPIRVKIDMSGDQMSVQFSSASSEVRQVLEDALPRLREQLSNSGIQLGQANVGSQSQQTPREAFAQSTPSPRSPGEGAILPAESPLEAQSSGRLIQSGRGLVDLFA